MNSRVNKLFSQIKLIFGERINLFLQEGNFCAIVIPLFFIHTRSIAGATV